VSWEGQGRQEHGWFGHGTAPAKVDAGGSEAELRRPDAARDADAAVVRAQAWAKAYGPALFDLPRSGAVQEALALLAGEMRLGQAITEAARMLTCCARCRR
jgi:hypothetical protein